MPHRAPCVLAKMSHLYWYFRSTPLLGRLVQKRYLSTLQDPQPKGALIYALRVDQDTIPRKVVTIMRTLFDAHLLTESDCTKPGTLYAPTRGMQSPWSLQATQLLQLCGCTQIMRIEAAWLGSPEWAQILRSESIHFLFDASYEQYQEWAEALAPQPPPPDEIIVLDHAAHATLRRISDQKKLALRDEDIDVFYRYFCQQNRHPTHTELMMFSQSRSEHCRHHLFHQKWHDTAPANTLMATICNTVHQQPHILSAYTDNSAIVHPHRLAMLISPSGIYHNQEWEMAYTIKAETHNYPTALAPFYGAATGVGGEIRDHAATGRGAQPLAGFCGISVSALWSDDTTPAPLCDALSITLQAPLGAARFANEFGRPVLCGYYRSYEGLVRGRRYGYHKPILICGGVGRIALSQRNKQQLTQQVLLVELGGPGFSSGTGGASAASLPLTPHNVHASTQHCCPNMQRRCQQVIDSCWQRGIDNPIAAIHDVGAGGLANACTELVHASGLSGDFRLRAMYSADQCASPTLLWCNEAQERYIIAVYAHHVDALGQICARERCPYHVIGQTTHHEDIRLYDSQYDQWPVRLNRQWLFSPATYTKLVVKPPVIQSTPAGHTEYVLADLITQVLKHPSVAAKLLFITINDRSVGGLTACDSLVGPWQMPVADCAVIAHHYDTDTGIAFALGERAPLATIDAAAAACMAVGEAITNLAAASICTLQNVVLSVNWMACGHDEHEQQNLCAAVAALTTALCIPLNIGIPTGKDSLFMQTTWVDSQENVHSVLSPTSPVVSAYAPVDHIEHTLLPVFSTACDTELIVIDLGNGQNRLGGSIAAQIVHHTSTQVPTVDDPQRLQQFCCALRQLREEQLILAYHDRSDGGLLASVAEMAFASHMGVDLNIDILCVDVLASDVDWLEVRPTFLKGRYDDHVLAALCNEELGVVIQSKRAHRQKVMSILRHHDLSRMSHVIGQPSHQHHDLCIYRSGQKIFSESIFVLLQHWFSMHKTVRTLRDHPEAGQAETQAYCDEHNTGLYIRHTPRISPTRSRTRKKPRVAILREQGTHGHQEMAAAFHYAGFSVHDVHMTDVMNRRERLHTYRVLAICSGFSWGDIPQAGLGWAQTILHQRNVRQMFTRFFARPDTLTLGICNGSQMLSYLSAIMPGTPTWPSFVSNGSLQFESRMVMVEVLPSPSVVLSSLVGSHLPVIVAHGEGRVCDEHNTLDSPACMRYLDPHGNATTTYPYNPNGSSRGVTGFTSPDGRITLLMPHPERLFRWAQWPWHPPAQPTPGRYSPWFEVFTAAQAWCHH